MPGRAPGRGAHKSLAEIAAELDVFARHRRSDCISIAGGDPLLHPRIVDIVAEIRRRGWKPILNTNGHALTRALLVELKRAGLFGLTFHVDSGQGRPGRWRGKDDLQLNALREEYALLVADVGGLACSFNATIYQQNLACVPGMIRWAQQHMDRVQTMVFICFRHIVPDLPFRWLAGDREVQRGQVHDHSRSRRNVTIGSPDLVDVVRREVDPEFAPAAYLNGTGDPAALKWLLTRRLGDARRILGYPGPGAARRRRGDAGVGEEEPAGLTGSCPTRPAGSRDRRRRGSARPRRR